jgi:hypothetical protein
LIYTNLLTRNDTDCSATYTLTLADGSAIDTSFITFSASSNSMTVLTTDTTKYGTYSLINKGTITGYTGSSSVTFSLVIDVCTITTNSIADYYYTIASGSKTIASLAWSSGSYCYESISYTMTAQSGSSLPSFITLISNHVTVSTSTSSNYGIYKL